MDGGIPQAGGIKPTAVCHDSTDPWHDVAESDWNDWRWQLRHQLSSTAALQRHFELSDDERGAISSGRGLAVGVTPHFARLCAPADPNCPLRRQVIATSAEHERAPFERIDPLGEDPDRVAPGVVHKYPDRVLLLVTDTCASYCRYCTRSRWVASHSERLGQAELDAAIEYIESQPRIVDVLISGGDPLLLSSSRLEVLLDRLAAIDHLRLIRIGTRVPIFLPMRIDAALCHALRPRRIPIWVNIHLNHARELPDTTREHIARLADAGIPLGGQSVLLRGVNDDVDSLRETFLAMLSCRIRPYYLFHCDPVVGSAHLRTSVDEGLALMKALVGHSSGMSVPKYCVDLEGGGKVPLWPDYVEGREANDLLIRSHDGRQWRYPVGG